MYKILLSILCVMSINAQMVGAIAIVVKGKAITLKDIEKEMQSSGLDEQRVTNILIRQKLEELEIEERRISVSSTEVYADIKQIATSNSMSVNEFYEAALNAKGISSKELKSKTKLKLLSTKLYSAIAYAKMDRPTDEELKEYYELNKETFIHPVSFTAIIYQTKNQLALTEKIQNPMFYSPSIATNEQILPYDRISPELAKLLSRTKLHSFTQIVPDGQGGFMSFYLKAIEGSQTVDFQSMKAKIQNKMMAETREKVLGDYFARLRHNAKITSLRTLQN